MLLSLSENQSFLLYKPSLVSVRKADANIKHLLCRLAQHIVQAKSNRLPFLNIHPKLPFIIQAWYLALSAVHDSFRKPVCLWQGLWMHYLIWTLNDGTVCYLALVSCCIPPSPLSDSVLSQIILLSIPAPKTGHGSHLIISCNHCIQVIATLSLRGDQMCTSSSCQRLCPASSQFGLGEKDVLIDSWIKFHEL